MSLSLPRSDSPPLNLGTPDTDPALLARGAKVAAKFRRYHDLAYQMAIAHRWAPDYIEQAPVLVLAVHTDRMNAHYTKVASPPQPDPDGPRVERRTTQMLGMWRQMVSRGGKLGTLMQLYTVAPQFRALKSGGALFAGAMWPIRLMTHQMSGSEIAPIIPERVTHQRMWLASLSGWYRQMLNRGTLGGDGLDDPLAYTRWAAKAFGGILGHDRTGAEVGRELADFAIALGPKFNTRWSLLQAADACGQWHNAGAGEEMNELGFVQAYGVQPDWEAPALGFIERFEHDGWSAVLLRSGRELWLEHCALRHCVDSYWGDVQRGMSRIYSIREGDRRIATLELRRNVSVAHLHRQDQPAPVGPNYRDDPLAFFSTLIVAPVEIASPWMPSQFQARKNTPPPRAAWTVAAHLMLANERTGAVKLQLTETERGQFGMGGQR